MNKSFWPAIVDTAYLPRSGDLVVLGNKVPSEYQYKIGVFQKVRPTEKVMQDIKDKRRSVELGPNDLQYLVKIENKGEPEWVLNSDIGSFSSMRK